MKVDHVLKQINSYQCESIEQQMLMVKNDLSMMSKNDDMTTATCEVMSILQPYPQEPKESRIWNFRASGLRWMSLSALRQTPIFTCAFSSRTLYIAWMNKTPTLTMTQWITTTLTLGKFTVTDRNPYDWRLRQGKMIRDDADRSIALTTIGRGSDFNIEEVRNIAEYADHHISHVFQTHSQLHSYINRTKPRPLSLWSTLKCKSQTSSLWGCVRA